MTSQDLPEAVAIMAVVSSSLDETTSSTEIEDFVAVYEYLSTEVAVNGLEVNCQYFQYVSTMDIDNISMFDLGLPDINQASLPNFIF